MAIGQILFGSTVSSTLHPITFSKHLMQFGYEPFPPYASKSLFGKPVLYYPNVLKYMGHIVEVDGFFGLYRGIGPRIVSSMTGNLVSSAVLKRMKAKFCVKKIKSDDKEDGNTVLDESWEDCVMEMFCELTARATGILVSQPFHVLMLRSMAQFIGRETAYNNSFSGLYEIYKTDGILGFFAGLIPRMLADLVTLSAVHTISHVITFYLNPQRPTKNVKSYSKAVSGLIAGQVVYPLNVSASIVAVNSAGLMAGRPPLMPSYAGWRDCLKQLGRMEQMKRGGSLFWRRYSPAPMQLHSRYRTGTLQDFI